VLRRVRNCQCYYCPPPIIIIIIISALWPRYALHRVSSSRRCGHCRRRPRRFVSGSSVQRVAVRGMSGGRRRRSLFVPGSVRADREAGLRRRPTNLRQSLSRAAARLPRATHDQCSISRHVRSVPPAGCRISLYIKRGKVSVNENGVIMRTGAASAVGARRHNENDVTMTIAGLWRYGDWRHVVTGCAALVPL